MCWKITAEVQGPDARCGVPKQMGGIRMLFARFKRVVTTGKGERMLSVIVKGEVGTAVLEWFTTVVTVNGEQERRLRVVIVGYWFAIYKGDVEDMDNKDYEQRDATYPAVSLLRVNISCSGFHSSLPYSALGTIPADQPASPNSPP